MLELQLSSNQYLFVAQFSDIREDVAILSFCPQVVISSVTNVTDPLQELGRIEVVLE